MWRQQRQQQQLHPPSNTQIIHSMNIKPRHGWLLIRARSYARREVQTIYSSKKTKNRELGTPGTRDLVPAPTILTTSEQMWRFAFRVTAADICLLVPGVVHRVLTVTINSCCWCVCVFFHLGLIVDYFFAHQLVIYSGVYIYMFFTCDPHPPTYSSIPSHPICKGFALTNRFKLKCWWVVGGVGWTTSRGSQCEVRNWIHFVWWPTVSAIKFCLLIWFITESGSCTFRLPRLVICCFPLHWRLQVTSSFVDRHKNTNFWTTINSMATEQIGVQFNKLLYRLLYSTPQHPEPAESTS